MASHYYVSSSSPLARVAQPPEFDLFPTSPQVVLPSDTMVLHAEISTNHLRTVISWQHDDKLYNSVLFEDPFCNVQLEVGVALYPPPLPCVCLSPASGVYQ